MTKRARRNHTLAFKAKVAPCGHQGREDPGRVGPTDRGRPEPDRELEDPAAGGSRRPVRLRCAPPERGCDVSVAGDPLPLCVYSELTLPGFGAAQFHGRSV